MVVVVVVVVEEEEEEDGDAEVFAFLEEDDLDVAALFFGMICEQAGMEAGRAGAAGGRVLFSFLDRGQVEG